MLEQVDTLTKEYKDLGQAQTVKDITQLWLLKIRYINLKSSMEPSWPGWPRYLYEHIVTTSNKSEKKKEKHESV